MKSEKTLDGKVSLILDAVISLQEHVSGMQADMKANYATTVDLMDMEERLTTEIRAIGRAVDKDALTIISHERRITYIERQVA
jgi:hypothetical protein